MVADSGAFGGGLAVPDVPQGQAPGPNGCRFAERCPQVMPKCRTVRPEPVEIAAGRWVACHAAGA